MKAVSIIIIILSLISTSFIVSTIVLAIQKTNLENDLNSITTTTTTVSIPTTVTTMTTTTTTTTKAPPEVINYRLNGNVKPTHYDLFLNPILQNGIFEGTVNITLQIIKNTNLIELHSNGLDIVKISAEMDNQIIEIISHSLDKKREILAINLAKELSKGTQAILHIQFKGLLLNRIVGFYRSSYTTTNGTNKFIASSKFEPTYARQAFPCFDEPAMKAKFKVTIVRPLNDNYIALSNMDMLNEEIKDNVTYVHFNESVEMSTYVSCFIVCDFGFDSKPIKTEGIGEPFNLKAYARAGQTEKIKFALDTGASVTEYYIQYFKIPYPLPKLDMIAIPDFVSGAMEHWGLVTFRETALLYDKTISSTVNKQRVGETVAHELAHMWFGNLVTMKWWDDLWLNEGFATFMSSKAVDIVYPEWKMMDQFIIEEVHGVMNLDATTASHPIVQKVENPDQITELFDAITYQKGASIIRMLEHFVTPPLFQEAVHNYLEAFKYNNAITDDLLTKIAELNKDIDVKFIMRTWTEQMGLPVVNVQQLSEMSYKLTQKRFFSNPEDDKEYKDSVFNYKWSIPVTYIHEGNNKNEKIIWFDYKDLEATINLDTPAKWIKFNKNQVGYYRVNYPEDMWKNLINVLKTDQNALSAVDRAHLLNDAFALADATQLNYKIALDLTSYLNNENEYVPWSVAASKFLSLQNILQYTDIYKNFTTYSRKLIETIYNNVGWTVGEDHLQNRLRITILELACSLEHNICMEAVAREFNEFLKSPINRPNPDLRNIVYYYGMVATGTEEIWDKVWKLFKDEQDPNEKIKLMRALSGIQIPWILNRFIELAWDEQNVRGQDYFTCLAYIADNPVGESLVWNYVRDNWQKLVDRFGLNERYLGRMIPSITKKFSTNIRLKEMEAFFKEYPDAGAGASARKQALQKVKINIKWLENNKNKVEEWLNENMK